MPNGVAESQHKIAMITTKRLREVFDYKDGNLIRKVAARGRAQVGTIAGSRGKNDYWYACVDNITYPLHLLVWIWHGFDPYVEPDHKNRISSDNRIENLRPATRSQNMWNIGKAKNNTSGVKGVTWHKEKRKYRVRLGVNGKRIHIGDFADLELAELVAHEARAKYHGQFANSI